MSRSVEDLAEALLDRAGDLPSKITTSDQGVYVLWLDVEAFATLNLAPGAHNAGYAGVAEGGKGLKARFSQEWRPKNSGRSSPRRTLGALLRSELDLHARPRPGAPTTKNADYYCFGDEGEARLTDWIIGHGRFSYMTITDAVGSEVETDLIRYLKPPLNIDKWDNPIGGFLAAKRTECKHASRTWQASQAPGRNA